MPTLPTDSGTPQVTTPSPPLVPMIDEALLARCPDASGTLAEGASLYRASLPNAIGRCNDGTPPTLYVRAATDPSHLDDFVLYLDGGAFCPDYEECAVRWCGEGFYDAGKMSTRWAPAMRRGAGIFSSEASNEFAGYNHVFFYYCSSDFWVGQRSDHVFEGDPPYRLHFEGHRIVVDGLDALDAGVVSDDGTQVLPPLSAAEVVIFGGSSAGGAGAIEHFNFVASRVPGAVMIGVQDGYLPLPLDLLDASPAAVLTADGARFYDEVFEGTWSGFVDPICEANEVLRSRCADADVVLRTYVASPVVVHHDLYDPVLSDLYLAAGVTMPAYAQAGVDTLRIYEAELPAVSLHGSACGLHTALDSNDKFFDLRVVDTITPGPPASLHDTLVAAVAGARVVASDDAAGLNSACPP